jgi:hypothetical protein
MNKQSFKVQIIKFASLLACMGLLLWACQSSSDTPKPTTVVAPSDLVYGTANIEIMAGQTAQSVKPSLKGDAPFTFSLTSTPVANGLTIDNTGIISIPNTLAVSTYKVSVTVQNAGGSKTFTDILTIVVKPVGVINVPPSDLKYTPNSLTITQNTSATSVAPTITGTAPITYSMTSNPATNNLTINPTTGVISATSTLAVGTYTINITAVNAAAVPVLFNNSFTINVTPANTVVRTTFEADVRMIFSSNGCVNCHADLATFTAARNRVNSILDRIQRQPNQGGFMPQGGTKVSDTQINTIKKWLADGLLER